MEYQFLEEDQFSKIEDETGSKKFKCNYCEHFCLTKDAIIYHLQSKHLGIRFECSECQTRFTSKYVVGWKILSIKNILKLDLK